MSRVWFHPEARAELLAAIRFYQQEAAGLGRAMAGEVRSALERISDFPESGSPDGTPDDLRRDSWTDSRSHSCTGFGRKASKCWLSCISGNGPTTGGPGSGRHIA